MIDNTESRLRPLGTVAPAPVSAVRPAGAAFHAAARASWRRSYAPGLLRFEHVLGDVRTAYLSDRLPSQHPHVAIVSITDDTLKDSKVRQPIDRALLARLVDADRRGRRQGDRHRHPVSRARRRPTTRTC